MEPGPRIKETQLQIVYYNAKQMKLQLSPTLLVRN
jgi:hypothetical protein